VLRRFVDELPGSDGDVLISLLREAGGARGGGAGRGGAADRVQSDPGGATLDQQPAKQLYSEGGEPGPWATVQQAVLGAKIDAAYPKAQIIAVYDEVVYFGHGFPSLDAADAGHFGVAPDALSWGQAGLLAGLVQAPSAEDPLDHPAIARDRQAHVVARLVDVGTLTAAQAGSVAAAPLHLRP